MQAIDAIKWLRSCGVPIDAGTSVLDLGSGFGDIGGELAKLGCRVTIADEENFLIAEYASLPFVRINIDTDDLSILGNYDLVICSNVLEHLARPERLIAAIPDLLRPSGRFYLSWTNWLSPWGGHEFSPFHYLGVRRGHLVYDRVIGRPRQFTPFINLFPTSIGATLEAIRKNKALVIRRLVPRYFPEFPFLMRLPGIREVLAWNCAMLIERRV